MRGRKPRPLKLADADVPVLEAVARRRQLCFFQAQHARTVLAVAGGEPVGAVARRLECDRTAIWRVCRRHEQGGLSMLLPGDPRPGRPLEIPPLQRARVVALACLEPVARGLHITRWASQDLARQAVADGIIGSVSPRTVRRILDEVGLQPHRTRYWRTARLDGRLKERAEKALWCCGNAQRLAGQGIWTVAADEKPDLQVLERGPIRRAIPGPIEPQEFEYARHGTVNLPSFLVIHGGRMEIAAEASKDARHYIQELRAFKARHQRPKGVYLIQDGDPGHTAGATEQYPGGCRGWRRPRVTPAHASWLNRAGMLIGAFGGRYLRRGSRVTREELVGHALASVPEYNQFYAHPFEWTWTNQQMRQWFARHAP